LKSVAVHADAADEFTRLFVTLIICRTNVRAVGVPTFAVKHRLAQIRSSHEEFLSSPARERTTKARHRSRALASFLSDRRQNAAGDLQREHEVHSLRGRPDRSNATIVLRNRDTLS